MPAGKEKHLGVVVLLWYLCVCVVCCGFVWVLFVCFKYFHNHFEFPSYALPLAGYGQAQVV